MIYRYNDYELLYLIMENDEVALEIMYKKYVPLIKRRIYDFKIKPRCIDDFFQEGLMMLTKAIEKYNSLYNKTFNKYFDFILQRRFIQLLKKEKKYYYDVTLVEDLNYYLEEKTIIISVESDLSDKSSLSKFEKEVYNLARESNSVLEIANILKCDYRKIYNALGRAKNKIKKRKCNYND